MKSIKVILIPGNGGSTPDEGWFPYVKTGLTECTTYKFYVRARCSDGGISPTWLGPVYFKTKCLGETCENPIPLAGGNQSVTGNTSNYGDYYNGVPGTG